MVTVHRSGTRWPLPEKVRKITSNPIRLADKLYTQKSMDALAKTMPSDKPVENRLDGREIARVA